MKHIYKIMRYSLIAFIAQIVSLATVTAQIDHTTLFKAMKDEMSRSKNELILPNSPAPYFISYTVGETSYITVSGTLGTILNSKESPKERVHSVNLYVGDSKLSSDYAYTGNGILSASLSSSEDNYEQLRRNFWQTSDLAYKFAVEVYNSKINNLKSANLTEEEKALADMLPLARVEELTCKLSAEFSKYPQVFNSRVGTDGIITNYYYLTTEGTKVVEPLGYVAVTFSGSVRNAKGQVIRDQHTIYASTFETLPVEMELMAAVNEFAKKMEGLTLASEMEEYYLGPVLFEKEAAATLFSDNLASPAGVISLRRPVQVMASVARVENISSRRDIKALEERINKKVIDSRISVVNRTDLESFNGNPLLGKYTMDAQGVAPVKEVSLIENGILKNLLSTRTPTRKTNGSTGSLRYGVRPRAIPIEAAPGTLVISATQGSSPADLKRELIKAAIEEGLDYAYIVRKIANQSDQYIYRVSVKDGSESLVIGAEITPVPLNKLKRVLGVCSEQMVYNFLYQGAIPTSVVYPGGVLVEDIEINKKPINVLKNSPLISNR
jgi:predicted Zn-dependent protease